MSRKTKVAGTLDGHRPTGVGGSSSQSASTREQEVPAARMPELRFPEFRGQSLREVCLGDVTEESKKRASHEHPVVPVMGVTKADGIIPMQTRLISADIGRYKLVQNNWFAYNPMRLNIGSIARWEGSNEILVSPDYVVFKCHTEDSSGIDPAYFDHFRQTNAWDAFVTEGGDGGVRVRIYYRDIARLRLALPSLPEQQKIADCLGSLDDLIAAHRRKLAALQDHKKGLLQQLFPAEGETTPKLRFPGFENSPEWQRVPLGDIAEIKLGKMLDRNKHTSGQLLPYLNNISVRWGSFDTTELPKMFFDNKELERYGLKVGDVLVCEGGEPGRSAVWDGSLPDVKYQKAVHRVRFKIPFEPHLLVHYLEAIAGTIQFEKHFTGGGIKHLTRETFSKLDFPLPSHPEQQNIADCLSALDACITAQTEQITALKEHKKGLMQQLFPSPELSKA